MRRAPLLAALSGLALLATACTTVFFSADEPTPRGGDRRVYVNDKAKCDSLAKDLVETGVKFVLQPGKGYQFVLNTVRSSDQLKLYYFKGGNPRLFRTLDPASDGAQEIYSLASDQADAQFFLAKLNAMDGSLAIPELKHVALSTQGQNKSDTLKATLLFVRKLSGLPDSASKKAFAAQFFGEMAKVYVNYGIVVQGDYQIVEPQGDTVHFPFTNKFVELSGTRIANHVHLYLVEDIFVPSTEAGKGPQGMVLGFSPREVVNIDFHPESRVILANTSTIPRLAVTAVHELGHFFGLRHTVSTEHDIAQDDDGSNLEDGFTDTRFCDILGKRAASTREGRPEQPYCLRIAGSSCSASCDLLNLMHPVECIGVSQVQLSTQQIAFLKTNIAQYLHP